MTPSDTSTTTDPTAAIRALNRDLVAGRIDPATARQSQQALRAAMGTTERDALLGLSSRERGWAWQRNVDLPWPAMEGEEDDESKGERSNAIAFAPTLQDRETHAMLGRDPDPSATKPKEKEEAPMPPTSPVPSTPPSHDGRRFSGLGTIPRITVASVSPWLSAGEGAHGRPASRWIDPNPTPEAVVAANDGLDSDEPVLAADEPAEEVAAVAEAVEVVGGNTSTSSVVLTARQREIIGLLYRNLWPNRIAHELGLSKSTVCYQCRRIREAFGVSSNEEAVLAWEASLKPTEATDLATTTSKAATRTTKAASVPAPEEPVREAAPAAAPLPAQGDPGDEHRDPAGSDEPTGPLTTSQWNPNPGPGSFLLDCVEPVLRSQIDVLQGEVLALRCANDDLRRLSDITAQDQRDAETSSANARDAIVAAPPFVAADDTTTEPVLEVATTPTAPGTLFETYTATLGAFARAVGLPPNDATPDAEASGNISNGDDASGEPGVAWEDGRGDWRILAAVSSTGRVRHVLQRRDWDSVVDDDDDDEDTWHDYEAATLEVATILGLLTDELGHALGGQGGQP